MNCDSQNLASLSVSDSRRISAATLHLNVSLLGSRETDFSGIQQVVVMNTPWYPAVEQGSTARQGLWLLLMADHAIPTNDFPVGLIVSEGRHTRFYFMAAVMRSSTPPASTLSGTQPVPI